MIDIHSHILPNIDDGSASIDETLEMLEKSAAMGVSDVIFTPHANYGAMMGWEYRMLVQETFKKVEEFVQLQAIDINLHLGMEIFGTPDLGEALENNELLSLAGTNYFLIEFPFHAAANYCIECLRMVEQYQLIPVIAHPERYDCVIQDPILAYEWNQRGYVLQVNAGSLLGEFGNTVRKTANVLLDHQLVQLVASDCHHSHRRSPNLIYAKEFLSQEYSTGYAELLLTVNPKLLLENKQVLIVNPRNPWG